MVANVKTAPVPPVPQYKNVLDAQGRFVSLEWLQWFVSVRDKINVINDLLVNLGLFTGGVPNIGPGGTVSAATTDDVPEGAVNKYFTETRVLETLLDGLTISPDAPIVDTDNVIEAFGKIQAQINAISAGGAIEEIDTVFVTGSAATTLSISGLDLGAYRAFLIFYSLDNATGSASNVSVYYNSDTTATHYYTQILTGNNTTVSGSRTNSGFAIGLTANETSTGNGYIQKDLDGKPRLTLNINRGAPSSIIIQPAVHVWTSNSNVTDITLSASVANSLAIGSVLAVYGVL